MTRLDDFFHVPPEAFRHQLLRLWSDRLDRPGTTAVLEVFRPEAELGRSRAVMDVQFTEPGSPPQLDSAAWDDELNAGLIALHVRAVSPENEAERFALGLRTAMRKAERQFGDGYFNSVLIDLLKNSDLTADSRIAEALEHAAAIPPTRDGRDTHEYLLCRELIAEAISGRAHELTGPLNYREARGQAHPRCGACALPG